MKIKFWKRDKPSIRKGASYFVNGGDYEDLILVFMEETETDYGFLTIPTQENLWVPKEKFDFAISEAIIEFVEILPKNVVQVTEFKFRENAAGLRPTP